MTRRGWLLFIAMGVIWGVPYLLIKIADREIGAPMLVEMRTGGAALLLLPLAVSSGQLRPVLRRWKPLIAFCGAEICLPWLFLFSAEKKLSSSLAGLLVAAVPLVSALLAQVTGSVHRLEGRRLVGIMVGLGGVAALVGLDVGRADLGAAAVMAVVAVGYALGPYILSRYLSDLPGLGVMAAALALAAIVYAPIATFYVPTRSLSGSVIGSAVGLTVLCTAIAFVLFFALIAEVGPVRSTVITYVNPAVAVVLGVSVLHERFAVGEGVGFVLIVAGCILAAGRAREGGAIPDPGAPERVTSAASTGGSCAASTGGSRAAEDGSVAELRSRS